MAIGPGGLGQEAGGHQRPSHLQSIGYAGDSQRDGGRVQRWYARNVCMVYMVYNNIIFYFTTPTSTKCMHLYCHMHLRGGLTCVHEPRYTSASVFGLNVIM